MKKHDQTSKILGLRLFSKDKERLLKNITSSADPSSHPPTRPILVFTPNPEQVMLAQRDPEFAKVLPQADYLLPDGIGLVLASRILGPVTGQPAIPQRITGVEVCQDLLAWAEDQQLTCLVVGGRRYEQLATEVRFLGKLAVWELKSEPTIYWTPGYEDVTHPTPAEENALTEVISKLQPDLVFVAFGAPYQEKWILTHQDLLAKSAVKIAMVVGGSFDVIFGRISRAPEWMRGGGEWLYRLWKEPWRWKRQLQLIAFIKLVLQEWSTLTFSNPGKDILKKESAD